MNRLDDLRDVVLFLVPPLVGALFGARYTKDQTIRERVTSWAVASGMGIFVGGGIAEHFSLGHWTTCGVAFLVASVGMEALGYIIAALRQGVIDPASTAGRWIDAILGRRP
jgi:hypothetical protein